MSQVRNSREAAAGTLGGRLRFGNSGGADAATLRGHDANPRMLAAVQEFPEITEFSILDAQLDAAALEATLARLRNLVCVKLIQCPRLGDDILPAIAELPELRDLNCDGSAVTDRGLACLAARPVLSSLKFSRTAISDVGVATLSTLPALTVLEVCDTGVSDVALQSLRAHERLAVLWASGTRITDEGMTHLATCPRLVEVLARGVHLTDAGVERLCGAKSLKTVYASGVFSRRSLAALGSLPELRFLLLEGDLRIGDEDVEVIGRMPHLSRLQLLGSEISPTGAMRLRELLPQTFVEVDSR